MNKIRTTEPRVIWNIKCKLGEGTLWVKEHNSIYFVDKEVGFLAHVKKNIFILGLQGEIRIQNLKSKKILKSIFTEPNIKLNRTNDGKTDSAGNLWFGTMDNLELSLIHI